MAVRASLMRWTADRLYGTGLLRPVSLALAYAGTASFPIFTYHRVNDDGDPFFPATPVAVFEQRMAYVARNFTVLTVEALAECMRRASLPRNAVAITFDDGYRDNLTNAAPILARYALPATIFLTTDAVDHGRPLWFDRLALAFRDSPRPDVDVPGGPRIQLTDRAARLRALDHVLSLLKGMPDGERRRAVDGLLDRLGGVDETPLNGIMLNWDDVQALRRGGFSIGAHTADHPILSRMSLAAARDEIIRSRAAIETVCGTPPVAFAYPNGSPADYSSEIVRIVREAGFRSAVTTRFGLNTAATSPYELRRGGPWEPEISSFALRLTRMQLTARLRPSGGVAAP